MGPQWLTRLFFRLGVSDPEKFNSAYEQMVESFGPAHAFSGDNLITWGKQLSFATDEAFRQAFFAAQPSKAELSLIWRLHMLHWAARRGLELEGDFVEAACFTGFTARVIANATGFQTLARTYWLYDRFSTAQDAQFLPGHHDTLHQEVQARFADCPNVRIVKGNIPEILAEQAPQRIAFLHLDINSAAAEIGALEVLYERVVPGAVIVLDDYGWIGSYRHQKPAHDSWFAARGKMVAELPTGQGLVIR